MVRWERAVMKLRSHPSMSYRGFQSWPPVWMREFGPETYPVGEVGILEDVHKSTRENHCFLVIKYNGSRYVGIIQCDDQDFFEKLYHSLSHACGQPIHEIGELDLDQS
jgi:hypothetical protein